MPGSAGRATARIVRTTLTAGCSSCSRSSTITVSAWKRARQSLYTYATSSKPSTPTSPSYKLFKPPFVNDNQVQSRPVSSIKEFVQLAEQGKADVGAAFSFLVDSRHEIQCLPFEKQREAAANVGAARLLDWIWTYRDDNTRKQDLNRQFSAALCWHLTAEGKDSFVYEWLRIEAANRQDRTIDTHWHGALLAGLVEARMHWDQSVDNGIALFLTAAKELHRKIHLVGAYVCIQGALQRVPALLCNPSLFDRFLLAANYVNVGKYVAFERAILALYHPTEPDGRRLLRLCQSQEQCPDQYPQPKDRRQKHFASAMIRASCILRLQGQKDDAEWLFVYSKSRNPKFFDLPGFVKWTYKMVLADARLRPLFDSSPHVNELLEKMEQTSTVMPGFFTRCRENLSGNAPTEG